MGRPSQGGVVHGMRKRPSMLTANNSHTPISKLSRKSAAFLDGCENNKVTASPSIQVKVNLEHLETREVFYTRP